MKVRLEIGPKDAEQSICTIARSQPTPGLVAYKRPGDVNESLPEQVRGMLDMRDAEVPAGDISKYEKKTQAQQDESEERCAGGNAVALGVLGQCRDMLA